MERLLTAMRVLSAYSALTHQEGDIMRFAKDFALIGIMGAVLGIALPAPVVVHAADAAGKTAQLKPASAGNAELLANAILNRWEPIAVQAGVHQPNWRDVLYTSLKTMDVSVLRVLDAQRVGNASDPTAAYSRFTEAMRGAIMQSYAQGAYNKGPQKLASTTSDLVFFPIAPCRIVDTRMRNGAIKAGTTRMYYFYADATPSWDWSMLYGGFAGSAVSVCPGTVMAGAGVSGLLGPVPPSAALATVTVVNTSAAGNLTIWQGNGSPPNTSSLNWSAGQVVGNTAVLPGSGRNGCCNAADFAITLNAPSGQTDVVVDILGYFMENHKVVLDCLTLDDYEPVLSNADNTSYSPTCNTGYRATGGSCSWVEPDGSGGPNYGPMFMTELGMDYFGCGASNHTASTQNLWARVRCCRVPGQ